MLKRLLLLIVILSATFSCSHRNHLNSNNVTYIHDTIIVKVQLPPIPIVPPSTTNPIDSLLYEVHTAGTPNFNLRKPTFVIIHHTAQDSCGQTLYTFSLPRTKVSAHYVICKDGTVRQLLNDYLRAWHAGISKWGNNVDLNSSSIGIELDNNGNEPFPYLQMNSLLVLLDTLKKKYTIPTANFIGHADIAPTRKNDPSFFFPWKQLSNKGFGLWYDDSIPPNMILPYYNTLEALRIIGYDIKDSSKAIVAFKRHFLQDTTNTLNENDKRILYNIYRKYL